LNAPSELFSAIAAAELCAKLFSIAALSFSLTASLFAVLCWCLNEVHLA
jgi:hypothetical protein